MVESPLAEWVNTAFSASLIDENASLIAAWKLGEDYMLVNLSDEAVADRLNFYLLQMTRQNGRVTWKGLWQSKMLLEALPDYRWIEPVFAEEVDDSLRLVLSVQDEQDLGLHVVSIAQNGSCAEGFLEIVVLDELISDWVGACPKTISANGNVLRIDFLDKAYRIQMKEDSIVLLRNPSGMASMKGNILVWNLGVNERLPRPAIRYGKSIVEVLPGLFLVKAKLRPKEKNAAKKASKIAKKSSLETFFLFDEESALKAHYLMIEDFEQYEPIWRSGLLGEWKDGIWAPQPRFD